MKRIFLVFSILYLSISSVLAQDRVVAMVFDNSGSMKKGGRFPGANYSLQLLIGLLNPEDEFYIVPMHQTSPQKANLVDGKQADINIVRKWLANFGTEWKAAEEAMKILQTSERKDKWLIIVTDGDFPELKKTLPSYSKYKEFTKNFIEETGSKVLVLNINDSPNTLVDLFRELGQADIYKTNNSKKQITSQMEKISRAVMGIPAEDIKVVKSGKRITISSPLPLKRLIVLEQSISKNEVNLPKLLKGKINGRRLATEGPFEAEKKELKGLVTHVTNGKNVIPKGEIVLEFDEEPVLSTMNFLPEVAAKLDASPIGNFKKVEGNVFTICDQYSSVTVEAKLLDLNGRNLAPVVLNNSKVNTKYNNKTKELKLENSVFKNDIPLKSDRTVFSVSADYQGYFNFRSNVFIVVKDTCPPPPKVDFGEDIVVKGRLIDILDVNGNPGTEVLPTLTLNGKNITGEEFNNLYLEQLSESQLDYEVIKNSAKGTFLVKPKSKWYCPPCFLKAGQDSVTFTLGIGSSEQLNKAQTIDKNDVTIYFEIQDATFWQKCGQLIILTILFLLFLIYLWGILRKPRFAGSGIVIFRRVTEYVPSRDRTYNLPTNFFNRWLVPFISEKKTVQGVTFYANKDTASILLPKKAQKKNMYIQNNLIEKPGQRDRVVFKNAKLEIRRKGRTDEYVYKT